MHGVNDNVKFHLLYVQGSENLVKNFKWNVKLVYTFYFTINSNYVMSF